MPSPILAQAAGTSDTLMIGIVVVGLTAIFNLAVLAKQLFGSNKGERQIEPTQIAALQALIERNHVANQTELRSQTTMLGDINREVGEVKATVDVFRKDVDGLHQRVGGISRELSATTARVDGLERREGKSS